MIIALTTLQTRFLDCGAGLVCVHICVRFNVARFDKWGYFDDAQVVNRAVDFTLFFVSFFNVMRKDKV